MHHDFLKYSNIYEGQYYHSAAYVYKLKKKILLLFLIIIVINILRKIIERLFNSANNIIIGIFVSMCYLWTQDKRFE
jgi:hypothetical protein